MLAFGHIRPNKNLDLVIQAMAQIPEVYLVVAGNELSSSQPLVPGYQALADELDVGGRIRWQVRFIPDTEVCDFFQAVDLAVLTYSQSFRSASGVLNTAAQYYTPCIASGGQGSLASMVNRYGLGVWVEPDNLNSIVSGLKRWLEQPTEPDWTTYHYQNSWAKNAELTIEALKS
jgi:glycosyltransferase involved in cell wall biosynthesis